VASLRSTLKSVRVVLRFGWVLVLVLGVLAAPAARAADSGVLDPDHYGVGFGANEADDSAPLALEWAHEAHVRWVRIGFYWQTIEPESGRFDWSRYDTLLAKAGSEQLEVLGVLGYATRWSNRAAPGSLGDLTRNPPGSDTAWLQYVSGTVERYRGQVHTWEVWNEPDLPHFWGGTAAEYAHLLAITHIAVKSLDPTATVVLGGLGFHDFEGQVPDEFLVRILTDPDFPATQNFDVASIHHFGSTDQALERLTLLRTRLSEAGVGDRPIWITETGQASDPDLTYAPDFAGLDGQAAWLRLMLPTLVGLGAERVFWFQLYDPADDDRGLGLLDRDLTPKPVFAALRALLSGRSNL
jgi:Beta-galactosidase